MKTTLHSLFIALALLAGLAQTSKAQVLFYDNFQQFANGTALTITNYTPASGPGLASVVTSVQNGLPTITATNFLGNTWALFDNSVVINKNSYRGYLSSIQTAQSLQITWKMWIQATNTGPGMFLLSVPTDDQNADYNPPIVFMDTGAIVALTNGTAPLITIGNWGSLAGTVMTNTLILNYPNGTFSYALNGQTMATMPLGPYFSNVVDSVTFTGFERSAGSLGNRFAISDVQVALSTSAQAQGQWAERVASTINTDDELSIGMTLDTNGNCYVTGWFDGTNNFGGVTLTNLSGGGQDIFVAKYNSTGALQWVQLAGGNSASQDVGRGVGVDTNGNVYATGGFYSPAAFGSFNMTTSAYEEFFLAKYNSTGAVQWVQQSTGGYGVYGSGLTVDGAGNSYAVGVAENGTTITFGTTNLLNANTGDYSAFLVKYDNRGTNQWAQLMGGSGNVYATKIAVDTAGNVYVRGCFTANITIGTSHLVSTGSPKNMFIAKFNNSGALTWVQQATGGNVDEGGVAVDQAQNVYVAGYFTNMLNFGSISLTNAGSYDAFVAKYNSSGAIQWARQAGGGTNIGAIVGLYWDVALDGQGNVYPAGSLSPSGSAVATVAKYNPAGTLQWTYSASGLPASPIASGVFKSAVDSAGNCYLAGWYQGTNAFGTNILQPQGYWNYFLVKLSSALAVNTTSLPNGANGVAYNQTLAAFGGQPPYIWTNNSGVLPPGLTLATNGVISGTPTANGTFNFTVKVTDAASNTSAITLELTVLTTQDQGNGVFYQIPKSEYDALVDLYNSTEGNAWTTQTGWLNPNATSWSGIGISGVQYDTNGNVSVQGNVTIINLQQNNLLGTIPTSIGNISKLYYLRLSFNQLTGSIPSSIGNLSQLWLLYLHYNNLSGSIPNTVGNLSNLQYLYLRANNLSGSIPSSFGNLTELILCGLGQNQLSGSIPSSFGNLTNITDLDLNNNLLTGGIPSSFANLSSVQWLQLENNELSGNIPDIYSNMTQLSGLGLNNNQFTGVLPASLCSLTNLQSLNVASNQLDGNIPLLVSPLNNTLLDPDPSQFPIGANFAGNCFKIAPGTQSRSNIDLMISQGKIIVYLPNCQFEPISVTIVVQPTNPVIGGKVTLNVAVTGTGPFSYQWQLNGTNLPNGIITTVAGGYVGADVPATNASLKAPVALLADKFGNLLIADTSHQLVRRVDTNGIITTVAGNGNSGYSGDGGQATNACLNNPSGVAMDAAGNLFIAEGNNVVRRVDTNGIIMTVAGGGPDYPGDSEAATNVSMWNPTGMTVDTSGNLFIAVMWNNVVRRVDTHGVITTVAGNGTNGCSGDGGAATNASLNNPSGVAVDAVGNLFIADNNNYRVRKVGTNGIITTIAGGGTDYPGDGEAATNVSLGYTWGVSVDTARNVYIADFGNSNIRRVDVHGIITTVAGGGTNYLGDGGAATNASLNNPEGVSVDATGNLFIADTGNNRIRKVAGSGVINTVAGGYLGDGGLATNASLDNPEGVALDEFGNLYISDSNNQRIRKVGSNGIITTVAGNGINSYGGDFGAATNASLSAPDGVAVDAFGHLFIADAGNSAIRQVDSHGLITTVAGNGPDYPGDGESATNAVLWGPCDVAVDSAGDLFIAEYFGNRIRKVGINGIISTAAGNGNYGYSGDGGAATNASIANPTVVTTDASSDLFIADTGNSLIRKVDTAGIISTVAGGGPDYPGDGETATNVSLNNPQGVTVDVFGNLFIADSVNNVIRQVDTTGIITTVAGNGNYAYSGDGGAAANASIANPENLATDSSGDLFIADFGNDRIRKVIFSRPILVLNNMGFGNAGAYDVVVSGPYGSVTSSVVNVGVTLPVILSTPKITVGKTNFTFQLSGPAGSNYVLLVSTNLLNWTTNSTSTIPAGGTINLTNAITNYSRRFYKVHLQ